MKQGQPLLGELDHPDGTRFETYLKNVSHQIVDVWYDKAKHYIMGKIKLLDTPAGKIAKALVDANVPLFISSRAVGSVKSDNHVVIEQLFTWDLVAKPGFEEARLTPVLESCDYAAYAEANQPVNKNVALKYNITDKNVMVYEINESDDEDKKVDEEKKKKHATVGITTAYSKPSQVGNKVFKVNNVYDSVNSDLKPKAEPEVTLSADQMDELTDKIVDKLKDVVDDINRPLTSDETDGEETNDKAGKDDEAIKVDDPVILSIKPVEKEPIVMSVEPEFKNDLSDEEKIKYDAEKKAKGHNDETEENEEETKDSIDKYDKVISKFEKETKEDESVKESYPWSRYLKRGDFNMFKELDESQKAFIDERMTNDNVVYQAVLNEDASVVSKAFFTYNGQYYNFGDNRPDWYEYAPKELREQFNNMSRQEKEYIRENAELFTFNDKTDVYNFWNLMGFNTAEMRKLDEYEYTSQVAREINEQYEM